MVGLNMDFRPAKNDSGAFSFVSAGYYDQIIKADGIPVILPPLSDEGDISRVLDTLDGFVLMGGADLDCRNDGFLLHPSMRIMDSRRERFDRTLIHLIAERKMPVFGIGAGMQLINVSLGGTLSLHIPDDFLKAIPHLDPADPLHRHGLNIKLGTLMERVYGECEVIVNSLHHQAVDDVAPGFSVTAKCPDGIIEAIEWDHDDWFAIGTQFHPENQSASLVDHLIFEQFIEGIKNPKSRRKAA
jgi:putative glutamine amidotransferase